MSRDRFDYRLLFEQCAEGILVISTNGEVLDTNGRACEVLERDENDLLACGLDWVFDSTDSRLEPAFQELRRTGRFEGELGLLRGGWEAFPAEVAMATFEKGRASVVFRDITGRKRMEGEVRRLNEDLERRVAERTRQLEDFVARLAAKERMLRASEERFRITFDQAAIGLAHVAPDGQWLRVNERLCAIVRYDCKELLEKTFQEITHPDDLDKDLEQARQLLEGKTDTYSMEKRYLRKDGGTVWIRLTVSLVREPSGDPDYFIAAIDDINERKRVQDQIQSLTPREREVLQLLAQGQTNREVGESLNFSASTVKLHVRRICEKLEVSGRTEAAARAVELGLAEELVVRVGSRQ